jgi:zinc/manganese transport system substrate-binding protein
MLQDGYGVQLPDIGGVLTGFVRHSPFQDPGILPGPVQRGFCKSIGTILVSVATVATVRAGPVEVVAAENFYGDVVQQIGGAQVSVTSILSNPDQDPHLFEASAATARRIADAKLVVYNGADYDPWAGRLLSASVAPARRVVEVAQLVHKKPGDNPHIWYDPATMPILARRVASILSELDSPNRAKYAQRLAAFEVSMRQLVDRISELRAKYAGMPVTATEPVFGYMADALGLKMRNGAFQLAMMNGTEPGASKIAAFEKDLRTRTVRVLLYNSQTGGALSERMREIATRAGVAVIGVTETEPAGMRYQEWMLSQLDALDRTLASR